MATLIFEGIRVDYIHSSATGDDVGAETSTAKLRIVYDASANFLNYVFNPSQPDDDDLPTVEVTNGDTFYAAIDGFTISGDFIYNSVFPGVQEPDDFETSIVEIDWSYKGETGTSVVAVFDPETPVNVGAMEYIFVLHGDRLPASVTTDGDAWFEFVDSDDHILDVRAPGGDFAAGQDIPWRDFDQGTITSGQRMVGNKYENEFYGTSLRDHMSGLGGDDYFISSKGRDTYNGGGGDFDQVTFHNDPGGVTVNLQQATNNATDGWGDTETLTSIEVLRGSMFDDSFTGKGGTQYFRGLAGDDMINGGSGRDEVRYDRDARYGGESGVTVDLSAGTATDGFGDSDTLVGIESVRASDYNDDLTGSDAKNRLRGEDGNDTLDGGRGDDTLEGGDGNDRMLGGGGNDDMIGNRGRDTMSGQQGSDELRGYEGNDRLQGGAGRDTMDGGTGRDTLNGGTGDDELFGGGGNDLFVFKGRVNNDVIRDFQTAGSAEKIDLSAIKAITGFNDLMNNHIEFANGNVLIRINKISSIELNGITSETELSANDFIF